MKLTSTKLNDCIIIEPDIFEDERGFFFESFQYKKYYDLLNIDKEFVQDNHSHSVKNVIRGLHFQKTKPQGKLVRIVSGEVFDVVVDLRRDSDTFGQWDGIILSSDNHKQIWVPPGFAHGFSVLSQTADLVYKCTDYYDPSDEGGIIWSDSGLAINWQVSSPILSKKDAQLPGFYEVLG